MKKTIELYGAVLVALLSSTVFAEDEDPKDKAVQAFQEGKRLYGDKKFKEAADAFRLANHLRRSWKLLYNIGQCEAAAKRYGMALDAFERYVAEGVAVLKQLDALSGQDGRAAVEAEIEARVLALRQKPDFSVSEATKPDFHEPATQFCTQCGHPADPKDRFCARCGTPLKGTASQ